MTKHSTNGQGRPRGKNSRRGRPGVQLAMSQSDKNWIVPKKGPVGIAGRTHGVALTALKAGYY